MSGEDALIARYFAPFAGPGALGLQDDAGLVSVAPGEELVVTVDALVAGVHFFPDDPPASIARKAMGVNLSDLAAKAARPVGFLLTLALPPRCEDAWLRPFAAALAAVAVEASCPLVGGDTVSTPGPLMLSVTAFGAVRAGTMLPRTGARAGDLVYVSGTIGDAALGLAVRAAEREPGDAPPWVARLAPRHRATLRDRYWHPRPRLGLRDALGHASGGMDVSDGLVGDLAKMLRASGRGGTLHAASVPLSAAVRAAVGLDASLWDRALTGGDDYELLVTVPPDRCAAFEAAAGTAGIPVTAIGFVAAEEEPLAVLDAEGRPVSFARPSFSHV